MKSCRARGVNWVEYVVSTTIIDEKLIVVSVSNAVTKALYIEVAVLSVTKSMAGTLL
nr:hypothetical protein [Sinobaca sp. H24]